MTFREISVTSKMSISGTVHLVEFDLNELDTNRHGQPNPRLETDGKGAAQPSRLARLNDYRSDDINSIEEDANEVHDQLVRTSARIADGVRECPEADPGGFHSMEGTR